jgi:hypothetical protein
MSNDMSVKSLCEALQVQHPCVALCLRVPARSFPCRRSAVVIPSPPETHICSLSIVIKNPCSKC